MDVRPVLSRIAVIFTACMSLALCCGVASASAACPNETIREEQNSTYLPDCRAYEMVSPLDKNGADVEAQGLVTVSSRDGEAVSYASLVGFGDTIGAGAVGFTQYVASRKGTHWSSHGVTPTPGREAYEFSLGSVVVEALSSDLSHAVVESYHLPAASGDIPNGINLYSEDTATRALETITTPLSAPLGLFEALFGLFTKLRGYSPDLGVVTFESEVDLLPETTGSEPKLYAWEHGKLTLAGVLPNGTLPPGGSGAAGAQGCPACIAQNEGTVNDQGGSRIAFVSPVSGEQQLYLRRDGNSTAWVSEPETSVPVAEPHGVAFQAMSGDGRHILFTSSDSLLDGDPGGLYMYTDSPSPATESNLTFIAPTNQSPNFAVSAVSDNGRQIYFFIEKQPGYPQTGTYLWDEGTLHFVTPINPISETVDGEGTWGMEASADGRQFAYELKGGIYVYDEQTESLRCASCVPGESGATQATIIPQGPHEAFNALRLFRPRFVAADGRHVFFSSHEPLVPSDTNGLEDVYEYDVQSGAVSLLSSGTGENEAWLGGVSASGNDVFILTRQPLVHGDSDTLRDLYDVRVDGGFPEPQPQTGPCVGDECQGTPSAAPSFNTASGFIGLGNAAASRTSGSASMKAKPLTRGQKLAQALRDCRQKPRKARKRCQAQARRRYGPVKKTDKGKTNKSTSSRARR